MKKHLFKILAIGFIAAVLSACYTFSSLPGIKTKAAHPDFLYTERPVYPLYLNGVFIYRDLEQLTWVDSIRAKSTVPEVSNPFYTFGRNGKKVLKNTLGASLISIPPFMVANYLAIRRAYKTDGLSFPYLFLYHWYGGLLLLLGVVLLWKALRAYFSAETCSVVLASIVGAAYFADLLSILEQLDLVYLFFLHSALLYGSARFFDQPSRKSGILNGLILGLIVLIRPVEIILVLVFLLWKVSPKIHHLRVSLYHLIKHYKSYLYFLITFLILCSLQVIYWWKSSGEFFVFNDQILGVTSDISRLEALTVSPGNGFLIYSPILMIMSLGIFLMRGKLFRLVMPLLIPVVLMFLSAVYYYFWWNGGDSGLLYITQLYPFLAFPFAALVEFCLARLLAGLFLWAVIGVLSFFNLWRIYDLAHEKLLGPPDISYEYLYAAVLQDSVTDRMVKLLDTGISFGHNIAGDTVLIEAKKLFCLNAKNQYSKRWELKPITEKPYFRFSIDAISQDREPEVWKHAQMIVSYYKGNQNIGNDLLRIQRLIKGKTWQTVWLDSKTMPNADRVVISIWNADSTNEICFRNLKLIGFDGILQAQKSFKSLKK